jgi:hypothetical protein
MNHEPRQCIKCGYWFRDSIFYPEGHYGCRWHNCDRINHVTRTEELRPRRTTLLGAIFGGTK